MRSAPGQEEGESGPIPHFDPKPRQRTLKEVLQLRLQLRRNQEQLTHQSNMAPLKGLPLFIDHRRGQEQGKGEDSLKHKMSSLPQSQEPGLINTPEDPTETKQKKMRLAHDLNDKILHRPGPLDLLDKNILPLHPTMGQVIKDGNREIPETGEPEGGAECAGARGLVSPRQPGVHQPRGADTAPWQRDVQSTGTCGQSTQGSEQGLPSISGGPEGGDVSGSRTQQMQECGQDSPDQHLPPNLMPQAARPPRVKRAKEPKPRVRKLKYHQYVPPTRKGERGPVPLDSAYGRLLQQQQVYLQLQILRQQEEGPNGLGTLPSGRLGPRHQPMLAFATTVSAPVPCISVSPAPRTPHTALVNGCTKPELLPANLEDLTVSELRQQLRKRGLPVSGTKPALLDRLKPYQMPGPKLPPPPPGHPPAPPLVLDEAALLEKQRVIERLARKLRQEQRQSESLQLPSGPSPMVPALPRSPFTGLAFPDSPPSPANPFLFPSPDTPSSPDGNSPSSPQRQKAASPRQARSVCDPLEPQKVPTDFTFSPASLHSLFPIEDVDFDTRNESGSDENFDSEVLLCSSLGSDSTELSTMEGLVRARDGAMQSLEFELTEAIRSAELSRDTSIEEILDEPLVTTGPCVRLDFDPPRSADPSRSPSAPPLKSGVLRPSLDLVPDLSVSRPPLGLSPPSSPCFALPPGLVPDSCDWGEGFLSVPGCLGICGPHPPASAFSTDFLDLPELNVNAMIDLLVEQW